MGPTILEVNLRFSKELHADDHIVIQSHVEEFGKKFFKMRQQIFRGNDLCCDALFTIAVFDLHQRKIIELPPEWIATF